LVDFKEYVKMEEKIINFFGGESSNPISIDGIE